MRLILMALALCMAVLQPTQAVDLYKQEMHTQFGNGKWIIDPLNKCRVWAPRHYRYRMYYNGTCDQGLGTGYAKISNISSGLFAYNEGYYLDGFHLKSDKPFTGHLVHFPHGSFLELPNTQTPDVRLLSIAALQPMNSVLCQRRVVAVGDKNATLTIPQQETLARAVASQYLQTCGSWHQTYDNAQQPIKVVLATPAFYSDATSGIVNMISITAQETLTSDSNAAGQPATPPANDPAASTTTIVATAAQPLRASFNDGQVMFALYFEESVGIAANQCQAVLRLHNGMDRPLQGMAVQGMAYAEANPLTLIDIGRTGDVPVGATATVRRALPLRVCQKATSIQMQHISCRLNNAVYPDCRSIVAYVQDPKRLGGAPAQPSRITVAAVTF